MKRVGGRKRMEQKEGGEVQKPVVEFENGDKFSTASAGGEGRNRELMCNGRDKRGTKFGGEFESEELNRF